jgi:hypothetical protein
MLFRFVLVRFFVVAEIVFILILSPNPISVSYAAFGSLLFFFISSQTHTPNKKKATHQIEKRRE